MNGKQRGYAGYPGTRLADSGYPSAVTGITFKVEDKAIEAFSDKSYNTAQSSSSITRRDLRGDLDCPEKGNYKGHYFEVRFGATTDPKSVPPLAGIVLSPGKEIWRVGRKVSVGGRLKGESGGCSSRVSRLHPLLSGSSPLPPAIPSPLPHTPRRRPPALPESGGTVSPVCSVCGYLSERGFARRERVPLEPSSTLRTGRDPGGLRCRVGIRDILRLHPSRLRTESGSVFDPAPPNRSDRIAAVRARPNSAEKIKPVGCRLSVNFCLYP
ncbi:hypothetical protein AAG570_012937 [Ranatra chinensis]|uniref:Uncharacterized protein n=1 Tax=Ranatra chinensis TaxID=642074 RepID=A0ABD0YH79_9HEMI